MSEKKLQVIPLGGLGEFGMNMTAIRYGDDIIVIDCGMMFPEAELLGVDLVMPDLTFLKENQAQVRALILTHGHEDHIGAVPYFLQEIDVPVYGTAFTLALVDRRLEEYELEEEPRFHRIKPKQIVEIGPFKIEFIHVTHSIVSAVALAITTPAGRHHPHRRFQGGPHPHRQRAVRPAHAGGLRQARRAAAALRFHQCGPPGLHRVGAGRAPAHGGDLQPLRTEGGGGVHSVPPFTAFNSSSTSPRRWGERWR